MEFAFRKVTHKNIQKVLIFFQLRVKISPFIISVTDHEKQFVCQHSGGNERIPKECGLQSVHPGRCVPIGWLDTSREEWSRKFPT